MAIIAPTVETIGDEALTNSIIDRSITEIQDDLVTKIRGHAFHNCTALKKAVFGSVTTVINDAFDGCTALKELDFHARVGFSTSCLQSLPALDTLILRSETMCGAASNAFANYTPIANGAGYIYVPASLVDAYKADANWSTYASQIRAIEDHPEVCSTAGKVWKQSNVTTDDYTGVLFCNGVFVAHRSGGGVVWSSDGREWSSCSIEGGSGWYYGTCGNGVVVLGNTTSSGGLFMSTDGKAFSKVYSGAVSFLKFVNGAFFAYVTSVGLLKSEDGATWTLLSYSGAAVKSMASDGELLIAGDSEADVFCSFDGGTTWTKSNYSGNAATVLSHGNGVFVCGGSSDGLYYSSDGMEWTKSNRAAPASFVDFQGGLFHTASYSGGIYYSEDGATWSQSNIATGYVVCVVFENGLWVTADVGNRFGLYYSPDGKEWVRTLSGLKAKSICFGNGVFCAVTTSGIYYSE